MNLRCMLFGHKWCRTRAPTVAECRAYGITPRDARVFGYAMEEPLRYCLRCGAPNPIANQAVEGERSV